MAPVRTAKLAPVARGTATALPRAYCPATLQVPSNLGPGANLPSLTKSCVMVDSCANAVLASALPKHCSLGRYQVKSQLDTAQDQIPIERRAELRPRRAIFG